METLCMKCGKTCRDEVRRGRRLVYCSGVPAEKMQELLEGFKEKPSKQKPNKKDRGI